MSRPNHAFKCSKTSKILPSPFQLQLQTPFFLHIILGIFLIFFFFIIMYIYIYTCTYITLPFMDMNWIDVQTFHVLRTATPHVILTSERKNPFFFINSTLQRSPTPKFLLCLTRIDGFGSFSRTQLEQTARYEVRAKIWIECMRMKGKVIKSRRDLIDENRIISNSLFFLCFSESVR